MAGMDHWKRALSEPKAAGWIAFLILVVGIGVGTLIFDRGPLSRSGAGELQPAALKRFGTETSVSIIDTCVTAVFHVKHSKIRRF